LISRFWIISSLHPMAGIIVLPIMGSYNPMFMEANTEMTDFEIGSELKHDLGDYPDSFGPGLYDL